MSKRYIDADKLLTTLPDDLPYKASVKRVLMQAPSEDVVEVVRCQDCKHLTKEFIGDDLEWLCKSTSGMINPAPDFYCSYGERREE